MNKKGSAYFGIIIAIVVYVFGILFIPFLTDDITTARNNLDCTNVSISAGSKLNCLSIDLIVPQIIWIIVSMAIGFVVGGSGS